MPRFLGALCLVIVLSNSDAAQAQTRGPYVGILGGGTYLLDTNLDSDEIPPGGEIRTTWDTGFYIGGIAGYRISEYWRIEAELTYRSNNLARLDAAGPGFGSVSRNGKFQSVGFLGNVWFDIGIDALPITPYLGGGAGIGGAEIRLEPISLPGSGTFLTDDSETAPVLAYQVGAGIGIAVGTNVTFSLDYRYFATTDPDFTILRQASAEYATHNAGVAVRYEF